MTRGGVRQGAGRKRTGRKTVDVKLSIYPEQRKKLDDLGGSKWLRQQIDAAPTCYGDDEDELLAGVKLTS